VLRLLLCVVVFDEVGADVDDDAAAQVDDAADDPRLQHGERAERRDGREVERRGEGRLS